MLLESDDYEIIQNLCEIFHHFLEHFGYFGSEFGRSVQYYRGCRSLTAVGFYSFGLVSRIRFKLMRSPDSNDRISPTIWK